MKWENSYMSNNNEWYDDDDIFGDDDSNEGYDSDNGIKNLRKADRAKSKRIKELEAELESLRNFQRETTVSSVLAEKGVNPKIASFIPNDIATDAEAIETWLNENGEIFGYTKVEPQREGSVSQEDVQAFRRIEQVSNSAVSPDDVNDLASRINNAASAEEIIALLNNM
jgi:hypothetical protein